MSDTLIAFLFTYGFIAFGAALETEPRKMFRHPVERLVVRVSCGLSWPMLVGLALAWHVAKSVVESERTTVTR